MYCFSVKRRSLFLTQRILNNEFVVETSAKRHHGCADDNVACTEGLEQCDTLKGGASRKCHISLPRSERSTTKINHHIIKCETLALVHGERPSWFDGKLRKGAQHTFNNLFFFFIVGVLHILPHFPFELVDFAILHFHFQRVVAHLIHFCQSAIHPTVILVVTNENHLCSLFQHKFLARRQFVFGKFIGDYARKCIFRSGERTHVLIVDGIHGVAPHGKRNHKLAIICKVGIVALIQLRNILRRGVIVAHTVE